MRHWIVLAVVAAVAACAPAVSRADTTVNRVPLSLTSYDMCGVDAEAVAFSGQMTIVSTFVDFGDGIFHEQQLADVHLNGVGLVSGDRYVFNASGPLFELTFDNRPALVLEAARAVEIHAGEATPLDDFSMRMMLTPGGGLYVDESGCR